MRTLLSGVGPTHLDPLPARLNDERLPRRPKTGGNMRDHSTGRDLRRRALFVGACAVALSALGAGSAAAEAASQPQAKTSDATQVGEIVVTARKRNERL